MRRDIPGVLWIAIVALAVITVLTLLSLPKSRSLVPLVAAGCNVGLLVGLVMGQKWAYVLTVVFSVVGVAVAFGKGASHGLAVLVGNGLVLLPVLFSTRFFFPVQAQTRDP